MLAFIYMSGISFYTLFLLDILMLFIQVKDFGTKMNKNFPLPGLEPGSLG